MAVNSRATVNLHSVRLNLQPTFTLELRFQFKHQKWVRFLDGFLTFLVDEFVVTPIPVFWHIPSRLLCDRHCRPIIRFLDQMLSSVSLNLDYRLRDEIASKISVLLLDLKEYEETLEFYTVANVEITHKEVLDHEEIRGSRGDVVEAPTAASRTALKRLKQRRFYATAEVGGDCAICLEKFCGEMKLIKMLCDHVFHEGCIFRWLKDRNSCPICRRPVED